jgi:hypothetical protein
LVKEFPVRQITGSMDLSAGKRLGQQRPSSAEGLDLLEAKQELPVSSDVIVLTW